MKSDINSTYDSETLIRLKSVSSFLKEYRVQSGLTQELLAEYAELNRSSVIRLEQGLPVSFLTISKYASAVELPLNQLFLEIE